MNKRAGTAHPRFITVVLLGIILLSVVISSGCTGTPASPAPARSPQMPADLSGSTSWKEALLSDLQGRGNFSVSRFAGKTVIVPIVSASCPGCFVQLNRQLAEIDRLSRKNPGRIVVISLDLDPDYGPGFITAYGDPAVFTGYSARSPQDMTLALFHRFGSFSIDPATIPVILVCPDGHDLLLPPGVKTAESLDESMVREC